MTWKKLMPLLLFFILAIPQPSFAKISSIECAKITLSEIECAPTLISETQTDKIVSDGILGAPIAVKIIEFDEIRCAPIAVDPIIFDE